MVNIPLPGQEVAVSTCASNSEQTSPNPKLTDLEVEYVPLVRSLLAGRDKEDHSNRVFEVNWDLVSLLNKPDANKLVVRKLLELTARESKLDSCSPPQSPYSQTVDRDLGWRVYVLKVHQVLALLLSSSDKSEMSETLSLFTTIQKQDDPEDRAIAAYNDTAYQEYHAEDQQASTDSTSSSKTSPPLIKKTGQLDDTPSTPAT